MTQLVDRVTRAIGRQCPYCSARMIGRTPRRADSPSRDHVNPRALGGGPIIMCCRRCNLDKSDLPLREWAGVLYGRKDYRWKTVMALGLAIEEGRLKFVPDVVDVSGLAPGVFA